MELLIVGIGPGNPQLLTLAAHRAVMEAPLLVTVQTVKTDGTAVPRGRAEEAVLFHRPDASLLRLPVPMTRDAEVRDRGLTEQLQLHRSRWDGLDQVVLPVLGDSMLYATTGYLVRCWARLCPVTVRALPGVSAHSLLACRTGRELAQDDEIFAVVPGAASFERRRAVMEQADCVALYKNTGCGDLEALVRETGPWEEVLRGDNLSTDAEELFEGAQALKEPRPYMSTLLLRKERRRD